MPGAGAAPLYVAGEVEVNLPHTAGEEPFQLAIAGKELAQLDTAGEQPNKAGDQQFQGEADQEKEKDYQPQEDLEDEAERERAEATSVPPEWALEIDDIHHLSSFDYMQKYHANIVEFIRDRIENEDQWKASSTRIFTLLFLLIHCSLFRLLCLARALREDAVRLANQIDSRRSENSWDLCCPSYRSVPSSSFSIRRLTPVQKESIIPTGPQMRSSACDRLRNIFPR